MKIEAKSVKVVSLSLDDQNVRKHSFTNINAIKESLRKFGQVKPIVVNSELKVVAGNGTLTAAKDLGWVNIDVIQLPADWDETKIKAFAIADNRSAELAEWNVNLLATQLEELKEYGYELEDTGFSKSSLSNLIRVHESKEKGATDPYQEWIDMPEYDSEDKNAAFRVVIKFKSEEDVKDFFKIIDREKKSNFWYPEDDGFVGSTVKEHYVNVED